MEKRRGVEVYGFPVVVIATLLPTECKAIPFVRDAGHWIGIGFGIHTNSANSVEDKFSWMIQYDYRFKDSFGLLTTFQWWKTTNEINDGITTHEIVDPSGSLMLGAKFRLPLSFVTPFLTCGAGTGKGSAPFLLFYTIGLDFPITRTFHLGTEIRRTTIQEDSFFFMIGASYTFK